MKIKRASINHKKTLWFILWLLAFVVILSSLILFHFQKFSLSVFLPLIIIFTALAILSGVLYEWNSDHSPKAKHFWMVSRALYVFVPLIPALSNALRIDSFYTLLAFTLCCGGILLFFLFGTHMEKQNKT